MASKKTPAKVKRLRRKGNTVEYDGHLYRVNGEKLDRRLYKSQA